MWFSLAIIVLLIIVYQIWGFSHKTPVNNRIKIQYTQGQLDSLKKDTLKRKEIELQRKRKN